MSVKPPITNAEQAAAFLRKKAQIDAERQAVAFSKEEHKLTPQEWQWFEDRCAKHPKQLALLKSENRFKALCTPRRMGKTTFMLLQTLLTAKKYPGSTIHFVVPDSKSHGRRLFWVPFKKMEAQFKLGLSFHETDKRITTPDGTDILLFGAKDKDAAIQLRGDQSGLSLAILDECKDFGPHFEEVVIEAEVPALRDYGGTLVLGGSPGNILDGLFYRVTRPGSKLTEWEVARWQLEDNGYLPQEENSFEKVYNKYYKPIGVAENSPKVRREVLGEWCSDDSERVYLYDEARNHYEFDGKGPHGLPVGPAPHFIQHEWQYCLGLDLGERDDNAFVIGAFTQTAKELYIVETYSRSHMSIDEIHGKYRELEAKYDTFTFAVADTGGYGRGIVTELQNRLNLPIISASKKREKLGDIALMNSDFLLGRIKCHKESPLAKEWLGLIKKVRLSDHKVLLEHSDLGDAALYMHKASLHWASQDMEIQPLRESPEWWYKKEQDAIAAAVERKNARDQGRAPSERGSY